MQRRIRGGRGRYSARSDTDGKALHYLARMAVKHSVDSSEILDCIMGAWDNGEAKCDHLKIACRGKTRDSGIFLFTTGQQVLAQFTIPATILQGKERIEHYTEIISSEFSSPEASRAEHSKIKDLRPGMKRVSLKARVVEVPKPKMVYTRYGTQAFVSNALISDETGTLRMSLWNQQISKVSEGDRINIENGKVATFKGERQLRLGRGGILSVIE